MTMTTTPTGNAADTPDATDAVRAIDAIDAIEPALVSIVGSDYLVRIGAAEPPSPPVGRHAGDGDSSRALPVWRIHPGSAAEVAELVNLANRHRIAIVPVGGEHRAPPAQLLSAQPRERCAILLHTGRMNHVLHLDETSLIAHVQAGMGFFDLERVLAPRRMSLGDYPPAAMGSTIGGLLAVRTPGKSSPRHGFIEDAVLGISAVLADGRTIHTRVAPRRATGPDLARLLCGSEGTLGIITSVVLRIHRRPESRFLNAYRLPHVDAALAAAFLALREDAAPAALRIYDSGEARVHLGTDLVRGEQAVMVVATAGPTDLAACDRNLVGSAAEAMGGSALDQRVAEIWWQRRIGYEPTKPPPAPTLQVSASPATLSAVYHGVCAAVREHDFSVRAHISRFEHDGAVMFFTCTPSSEGAHASDEQALAAIRNVAQEAARANNGLLLDTVNRDTAPYLKRLRHLLDPNGVMNPHALTQPEP